MYPYAFFYFGGSWLRLDRKKKGTPLTKELVGTVTAVLCVLSELMDYGLQLVQSLNPKP